MVKSIEKVSVPNRETLVFPDAEKAGEFAENVEQRIEKEQAQTPEAQKEIVAEVVEQEMESLGEAAETVKEPWEHTQEEHGEAQELVNLAFSSDLNVALKKARESQFYPRNIDLMHDVLVNDLYEEVVAQGVNQQSLGGRVLMLSIILLVILVLILLVIFV